MSNDKTAKNNEKEYDFGSEMMFPSPAVKHDLSYVGKQYEGAFIEYLPFQGVDVVALESIPQTKAVSTFYKLVDKYFVRGSMPYPDGNGGFTLKDLKKEDIQKVPYAIILKLVQSAIQGELPENFTTQ